MSVGSNRRWLIALLASSCACQSNGKLSLEGDGTYDFGAVITSSDAARTVAVTNSGSAALELTSLEVISGVVPQVFELTFTPQTLAAGQTVQLPAVFHAPSLGGQAFSQHTATFKLHAGSVEAALALTGKSIAPECAVPASLDFGGATVGSLTRLGFTLHNPAGTPTTASVGALVGDPSFAFAADSATGELTLEPGGSREVAVTFTPTALGPSTAQLTVRAGTACPEQVVQLRGQGVSAVLTCQPDPLDFGQVALSGQPVRRQLVIANAQPVAVTLSQLATRTGIAASTEYTLTGPDTVTVPALGQVALQLDFRPSQVGPRPANLVGQTDAPEQPTVACQLLGTGAGQHVELEPAGTLELGPVPYFSQASTFIEREVTVRNTGTSALHFTAPPWTVAALNAASPLGDLCVGQFTTQCTNALPSSYDPVAGLAPGQQLLVPLRLTPSAANAQLQWEVSFHTDDPAQPTVSVLVQAHTVTVPPCDYEVTPAMLSFGRVAAPEARELKFRIHNLGLSAGDTCLLSTLDILPGSSSAFSLVRAPALPVTLAAGQSLEVIVRAAPSGAAPAAPEYLSGAVRVGLSSPAAPMPNVPLTATHASRCVTVSPADVNFGAVAVGCGSGPRTLQLFNTCGNPVPVSGAVVSGHFDRDLGGLDAGVLAVQPAAPVLISVGYHPTDAGVELGQLSLFIDRGLEEVVPLRGEGATTGANTDVFAVPTTSQADFLLTLENSGASIDKQALIHRELNALLSKAIDAGIDFHFGVVTSDSTLAAGELVGSATNPKVLTPATPNLAALYDQKIGVGVSGSNHPEFGSTSVLALSAPLVATQNAGFLRREAALQVLAVSSSRDWSPLSAELYASQLRALKGPQSAARFGYHVVGPLALSPPPGCAYSTLDADPTLHLALTTALGGLTQEVCSSDWSPLLDAIIQRARADSGRFVLTADPDLTGANTLTITVNGQPLAPSGWTFDASSRLLKLTAAPPPGATVRVSYPVACQ